ncbi:hypothetical protein LNQ81_06360 [Myroides sp. M-43]|uniref:hypothetical protein n=1 Tax=Myroides oncorhynchi TaxID=2893756 RepID=UPI001E5CCCC2|nr:hypothetical protein [Myroides oncorhynchi]MCC9042314.1 hypothetical protein [Myroides oncorhynchi]
MNKKITQYFPTLILIIIIIVAFFPYKQSSEDRVNKSDNADYTLRQFTTAMITYDKVPAMIMDIEPGSIYYSNQPYTIRLSSEEGTLYYYTNDNDYNFYQVGKIINVYVDLDTGATYILDIDTELRLVIQLCVFFLGIYIVIKLLTNFKTTSITILNKFYIGIFKPLFYTFAIILLLDLNIEGYNATDILTPNSLLVNIIHFFSLIALLIYLYVMYKVYLFYKKPKHANSQQN